MAILIKLLAGGLDLAAAIEIEGALMLGAVALAAAAGRHMLRPRAGLTA